MIKIFLCIAIILFTSVCGYLFGRKYRQKRQFFDQFKVFNERFLSEVTYYRRPILEFLSRYRYKGEFHVLLEDFILSIEQESHLIDLCLKENDYAFLSQEDKIFINDYFSMLGRSDSISQKAYFSSANMEIEKKKINAQADLKKYGDLYLKLGALCGILIVILII